MKRINLYMFREVLTAFLFATVAVSFVMLFTQSFRLLSFVIDNAATTFIFFQLMGLLVPTFLPVVMPLALGISVLFIYHKLAVDSEIVVMRAAGISPVNLAAPALALGGIVMFFCFLLTMWITPAANRALVSLQYRVRDNFSIYMVKPGAFNDLSDGLTFFVRKRGKEGELQDILVHDVRRPEMPVTIMADSGRFTVAGGEPQIMVFKGKRQEFDRGTGHLSELNFDRYVLDLKLLRSEVSKRLPDPREQTMADLLNPPAKKELRRRSLGHIRAEFHRRLVTPLLALSFAMIGFTVILAGQFNRRGTARRILIAALAIVALQAAVLSFGSLITRHGWLIPLLYVLALAPLPLCLAILRSPALWWRLMRWRTGGLVPSSTLTP
ncbi:MAG: LPS export ABC transporter permease LptF [Alphaproteobacteria bacterium]|nr:LPS export ABC transporter permease LptF [Alphaproteobacteria bacterium]